MSNCTIGVPGYRLERNCTLICRDAEWSDVAFFYLGNYVAHVATIKNEPGDSALVNVFRAVSALLFPLFGIILSAMTITKYAIFGRTAIEKAARAGALLMVVPRPSIKNPDPNTQDPSIVPNDLEAGDNDNIPLTAMDTSQQQASQNPTTQPASPEEKEEDWSQRVIHGKCQLPPNYMLKQVPATATFLQDAADKMGWADAEGASIHAKTELSSTHNFMRIVASILQLGFGIYTLVRARGDQIKRFGYAAFGLTVAPYAWMSLINFVAHITQPDYPTMFIVESSSLREARRLHPDTCIVTGTVGEMLDPDDTDTVPEAAPTTAPKDGNKDKDAKPAKPREQSTGYVVLFWVSLVVPIIVVGAFSRFAPGGSTVAQRAWVMTWIMAGPVAALGAGVMTEMKSVFFLILLTLLVVAAVVAAVGGFVVVGQMIMVYGVCTRVETYD